MTLPPGRYTLGPDDGSVLIQTGREGAAARLGRDLILEATRWSATVVVDTEDPPASRVRAVVDAGSLVVREARGGPVGLTDSQRSEIEEIVRTKVLGSARNPRIVFTSTAVEAVPRRTTVSGQLTIRRHTRPVVLRLRLGRSQARAVSATTTIVQTEFGIVPYSALLGALRVADAVAVTVEVRLPRR